MVKLFSLLMLRGEWLIWSRVVTNIVTVVKVWE